MEVVIRPWRGGDAARLLELYRATPDLARQLPALEDLAQAEAFVADSAVVSQARAVWCLEYGGAACGLVGVAYEGAGAAGGFDRGWVWYWSAGELRGKGLLKLAVRAVCDWALGLPEAGNRTARQQGGGEAASSIDADQLRAAKSPHLRRLELGYRVNNPASAAVAAHAGFVVEGVEREKFLIDGVAIDAVVAGRLASDA
ncbi:GNAT family N-acetyltransferase [Buchananella felis]|uniref:GNAT family N-acetyltransferase n=1 Tax=Buchananella felis TaxID=3231492 RepID=UPI003528A1C3